MSLARRDFLRIAAGSPFVFGLADLLGQEAPRRRAGPAWWEEALRRMKEGDRPALVFVAPATDEGSAPMARALMDLLESGDSRAQEIFCSAVTICLGPEAARACLPESSTPGKVLILDSAGLVLSSTDLKLETLKDPASFFEAFDKPLHGEGRARLAKRAEAVRGKLKADEKSALESLEAEELKEREKATVVLLMNAEALMPLLVFERGNSATVERAARLRSLIDTYFAKCQEKTPGPRLPFGTRIAPGHGCGVEREDVSVQCGMAQLEGKGQRLLLLLKE
ncbi:MAG TPA: hypothetical protein VK661_07335 [Planctomycetota bacterium]|nr:hypothetical protein [Planctomycetota bacterium]